MIIPQLEIRLRDGSNGKQTVEREYLTFTKLQCYDSQAVEQAREKTIAEIDDYINQLIIIRACI